MQCHRMPIAQSAPYLEGETHQVRDLTKELENTSNPKVLKPKYPAPLYHIIHHLVKAINSNDISGIKLVLNQLILNAPPAPISSNTTVLN